MDLSSSFLKKSCLQTTCILELSETCLLHSMKLFLLLRKSAWRATRLLLRFSPRCTIQCSCTFISNFKYLLVQNWSRLGEYVSMLGSCIFFLVSSLDYSHMGGLNPRP